MYGSENDELFEENLGMILLMVLAGMTSLLPVQDVTGLMAVKVLIQ